jgi:hypothetical protein
MVIAFGKYLNVIYVVIPLNIFDYQKMCLALSKRMLMKDQHVLVHLHVVHFVVVVMVDVEVKYRSK